VITAKKWLDEKVAKGEKRDNRRWERSSGVVYGIIQ
jgi:hypothetical protein